MQRNDLRDPIVDLIKAVDSVGKEAVKHRLLTKVVSFLLQNTAKTGRTGTAVAGAPNNNENNYRCISVTSQKAPNGFGAPN